MPRTLTLLLALLATLGVPTLTHGQSDPAVEDLRLEGSFGTFDAKLDIEYRLHPGVLGRHPADWITVATITLKSSSPEPPPAVTLRGAFPSIDVSSFWNPTISNDKANYYRNRFSSRATQRAPVTTLLNDAGTNRLTVAASDTLNEVDLATWMQEEDGRFQIAVTFCSERLPDATSYEVEVLLDTRPVPWTEALGDVARWWERLPGHEPAPVPDAARRPMYSTWYAFHQDIHVQGLLAELQVAASLGYEAVIVDDGWQTLDNRRGYAYTGDWVPERIGDMRAFVDAVHALGMDFLLWYSVPLMGELASNYLAFEGMYLRHWEEQGAWVLDPRYPEVREFLIDTYVTALREWDLDGFKFDFLGFFAANDQTVLTAKDGRDYASVDAAVDRLMTDVMSRLRAVKPDVLVEFRQPYIGPLMRKYGNMFRAVDCPNNAIANRAEITDVRLLAGNTAVHSDMLMWRPEEPVEAAALQLLNVLFSVPQLSVRLIDLPADHLAMVRFWTGFWHQNRDVLLGGDFVPLDPAAVYPVLMASRDGRMVASVHGDRVVPIDGTTRAAQVVNAKRSPGVVVRAGADFGLVTVTIRDVVGNIRSQRDVLMPAGIHEIDVPPSGLVTIVRRR